MDRCRLPVIRQFMRVGVLASTLFVSAFAPVAADAAWQRDPHVLLTNFHNMYNPCVVETGESIPTRCGFSVGLSITILACLVAMRFSMPGRKTSRPGKSTAMAASGIER